MLIKKLIISSLFLLFLPNITFAFPLEKIITEKQEKLDTYTVWWNKFNVVSIPRWKYIIMQKVWLNDVQKLHYHSINTIECWNEYWNCINERDVGPFQINIKNHEEAYARSKTMLESWDFEKLYEFQLKWTIDRLEKYKLTLCKDRPEDKLLWKKEWEEVTFWCMLKIHNWNVKEWKKWSDFKIMELFKIKWLTTREILLRKSWLDKIVYFNKVKK